MCGSLSVACFVKGSSASPMCRAEQRGRRCFGDHFRMLGDLRQAHQLTDMSTGERSGHQQGLSGQAVGADCVVRIVHQQAKPELV